MVRKQVGRPALSLVSSVQGAEIAGDGGAGGDGDGEVTVRESTIADKMMAIAEDRFELGKDERGEAYAVDREGPNVAMYFGKASDAMKHLGLLFFDQYGRGPSTNAKGEVQAVLEARADREPVTHVPIRVAYQREGARMLAIDMGDPSGRSIIVNGSGWHIEDRAPCPFRRTSCVLGMVEPSRPGRGSPEEMRKLFNFGDEEWDFMVNWQVTALIPGIAHVMPLLEGNPGTAKTSATKFLIDVIDPSKGSLGAPPEDVKALDTAAAGSWAFALENVSSIRPDISDGLARLITGSGTRDRKLYTDGDVFVRELQRVIIMNGIMITGIRPDLQDRAVSITVRPIPPDRRLTDEECQAMYETSAPDHLGYLLDVLSEVIRLDEAGGEGLDQYGRMASFERFLHLCDIVRGTSTLKWYNDQRDRDAIMGSLDDSIVTKLQGVLRDREGRAAEMTTSQWLMELDPPAGDRGWPKSSRALGARLRMLQKGLVLAGWGMGERSRDGRVLWRLQAPQDPELSRSINVDADGRF